MKQLNNGWEFTSLWTNAFRFGEGEGEPVRLPHNPRPIPQHYAGPAAQSAADPAALCGAGGV